MIRPTISVPAERLAAAQRPDASPCQRSLDVMEFHWIDGVVRLPNVCNQQQDCGRATAAVSDLINAAANVIR